MSETVGTHNEGAPVAGADFSGGGAASGDPDRDGADAADIDRFRDWYRAARDGRAEWAREAETAFGYVAGHQWSAEDAAILSEQGRPAVTFNRIAPFVDSVCGLEIGNRQEQRVIPRTLGADGPSELLTDAVKWARDECDAEDEESEAFRDCVICGEGWTRTALDYARDPDGMVAIERVDPLAVYPDPSSGKPNYADAGWIMYVKDMTLEAARQLAPDADDDELHASWADDPGADADDPHNAREAPFYRRDQSGSATRAGYGDGSRRVRLVEVEWWDLAPTYRVHNPATGQMHHMEPGQHAALQAAAKASGRPPVKSVKDQKRRYHKALLGAVVLTETDGAEQGGFSLKCITGKRDRSKGHWHGMVRAMQDPQMWANKWLSQTLHIINTNAKGGLFVEQDAVNSLNELRETYAETGGITALRQGGLGKIQQKEVPQLPPATMQLTEFAVAAIPGVTGVSPEMMGQVDRTQPGVLEMQRKQQGMVQLADFFNGLRRYRKEQGRLLVWLIQTFISDGRLIRIGGQDEAQYVPLIRDPSISEYDVLVDDTPSSPNMKERTWSMLVQLMPVLGRLNLPPDAMVELFKYSPLPQSLIGKIAQAAQQAGQKPPPPPPSPEEQAKIALHQAQAAKVTADAAKLQAETQLMPQRYGLDQQQHEADIEAKRAAAIAQLAQVGLDHRDQRLDEANASLDGLLRLHAAAQSTLPPTGAGPAQPGPAPTAPPPGPMQPSPAAPPMAPPPELGT